ncbi:MAG: hypothetical protein JSS04_21900 [Proteobacteria bacterium]|nr:hypothetical protein [Pseudomonadota bacterium]
MPGALQYRRLVLETGEHLPLHTLRLAGDLAGALGLDIVGISPEDPNLLELTRVALLRELRLPGHDWQPLDAQRLLFERTLLSEQTKRLISEEAAARGLGCAFGDDNDPLSASDIAVFTRPLWDAKRFLAQAAWSPRVGYESTSSAIVLVPGAPAQASRLVAAIGETDDDDPAASIGMRLASATGDDLVILRPPAPMSAANLTRLLEQELRPRRERLVILPPGTEARQIAGELADRRNSSVLVPSLAIGPSQRRRRP